MEKSVGAVKEAVVYLVDEVDRLLAQEKTILDTYSCKQVSSGKEHGKAVLVHQLGCLTKQGK